MSEGDSDCSVGTVRALIQELVAQTKDELPAQGAPVIRYRPPFIGTAKHDARSDAVQIVVDHLVAKQLPDWAAQIVALQFCDHHADDLHTGVTAFQPDVYEAIDASVWCRQVVAAIPAFLEKVASGEVEIPDVPDSYHQYDFSFYAERNRRTKMEDRCMCVPTLEMVGGPDDGTGLFGVFDGHGGVEAAVYSASHLAPIFASAEGELEERLANSMKQLDERLTVRCEKEHWKSGSTAVCVAIDEKKLSFAWVGDSSGFILKSTEVTKVTNEHSPHCESEAKRVEAAGGMLVWIQGEYRVNGILNLTRSLGDIAGRPMIIADADLKTIVRDGSQYMVILACDGVADALSQQQIYDTIRMYVKKTGVQDSDGLSEALCVAAKEEGSSDNLSVVIVFTRPPEDLWKLFGGDEQDDEDQDE